MRQQTGLTQKASLNIKGDILFNTSLRHSQKKFPSLLEGLRCRTKSVASNLNKEDEGRIQAE